jgi:hypothetical protein
MRREMFLVAWKSIQLKEREIKKHATSRQTWIWCKRMMCRNVVVIDGDALRQRNDTKSSTAEIYCSIRTTL